MMSDVIVRHRDNFTRTAIIARSCVNVRRGKAATSASTRSVSAAPTFTCCSGLPTPQRLRTPRTRRRWRRGWWLAPEERRKASRRRSPRRCGIRRTLRCSACCRAVSATCHLSLIRTVALRLSTRLPVDRRLRSVHSLIRYCLLFWGCTGFQVFQIWPVPELAGFAYSNWAGSSVIFGAQKFESVPQFDSPTQTQLTTLCRVYFLRESGVISSTKTCLHECDYLQNYLKEFMSDAVCYINNWWFITCLLLVRSQKVVG